MPALVLNDPPNMSDGTRFGNRSGTFARQKSAGERQPDDGLLAALARFASSGL